jgi:hypothetical protein
MSVGSPRGAPRAGPLHALVHPDRLWSRPEVLGSTDPVPSTAGLYAWYFRVVPGGVPTAGCVMHDGMPLLYMGISPKAPPRNGRPPSSQTLRKRIRTHYEGNASASTLRFTLGCLLAADLGISLRRVGSSGRLRFTDQGESVLSAWMGENAFVCWVEDPEPWVAEHEAIRALDLPLNLDQNQHNAFHRALSECRAAARANARSLPIVLR